MNNIPVKKIQQKRLVLASASPRRKAASPRRKALLEQMGLVVDICPAHVDESQFQEKEPGKLAKVLSLEKARVIARRYSDSWVLGADTLVAAGDTVLGKPGSREEAVEMLHCLSGREHSVFTAFTVIGAGNQIRHTELVESRVCFKPLSDDEIFWYVHTKEPYDKAGGYGIQGKAAWMIDSIKGSYTNVMGLPLREVCEVLLKLGIMQFTDG